MTRVIARGTGMEEQRVEGRCVGIADGDPLSIALGIALGDEDDGSSILRGLLLLAVPFVAGESAALLQLTLLPIAFLVARGMGMLPQRMALVLRSILLVLLLSQYLYALGFFELFRRVG